MSLNILIETITGGYIINFVSFISLLCILIGISIIITKNPVFSVLFLIGLFLVISIYLQLLGLTFLALSYLLVYVGAISILFLFIIMLLNVRVSELITEGKNSIPLAIITVICFNYSVNFIVPYCVYIFNLMFDYIPFFFGYLFKNIFFSLDYMSETVYAKDPILNTLANAEHIGWDNSLIYNSHIVSIGNILYSDLFILLFVVSLILLLSMVGTILITIKRAQ